MSMPGPGIRQFRSGDPMDEKDDGNRGFTSDGELLKD